MRKHVIAARVGKYVYNSVQGLTKGLGISISEYLRKLIIQDLDSKRLFEEDLARVVEASSEEREEYG